MNRDLIVLLSAAVIVSMIMLFAINKSMDYEIQTHCATITSKHSEQRSLNSFGDFETVHYLVYDDGTIEEAPIETYLKSHIGQKRCWEIKVRN